MTHLDKQLVKASKFLALVLRHRPDAIGVSLDEHGWIAVETLLAALERHGRGLSRAELDRVVAENDKQRFAFDATGTRIRANQGHTVPVALDHPHAAPPPVLYHGTHPAALGAIHREGLRPMDRHAVHLSPDPATAARVGARRGRPVVLAVDAARMSADGRAFRLTPNGVWLTDEVPPHYLLP